MKLDINVYSYPYKDGQTIFYSPIARKIALTDKAGLEQYLKEGLHKEIFEPLKDYTPVDKQRKVQRPEDYTLLTVLPNNTCNFACSYCYSAKGRNNAILSHEQLRTAIDFFIDSKPTGFSRPLSISFMGGGEPLLSWDNVRNAVEYAQNKAAKRHVRLNVTIITNGSILDDDIIAFCRQHNINVSVSFDIIRNVQNAQRKNYDIVSRNISRLCDAGVNVQINATITPVNVNRMTEMLYILHEIYPAVKAAMFEPVTGQQLFSSLEKMRLFYDKYIQQFIDCLKLADEWDMSLTSFAFLRTLYPIDRACPGELCLTADGFISGCYCIGSPQDELFPLVKYGEVQNGRVNFDRAKFTRLINDNVYVREECKACEVKWNCGGGCFYQFHSYSQPYRDEVCAFTRKFVEALLVYRIDKETRPIKLPLLMSIQ